MCMLMHGVEADYTACSFRVKNTRGGERVYSWITALITQQDAYEGPCSKKDSHSLLKLQLDSELWSPATYKEFLSHKPTQAGEMGEGGKERGWLNEWACEQTSECLPAKTSNNLKILPLQLTLTSELPVKEERQQGSCPLWFCRGLSCFVHTYNWISKNQTKTEPAKIPTSTKIFGQRHQHSARMSPI